MSRARPSADGDTLKELGLRIASLRSERGLTQQQISDSAEISRITLSKIERGLVDVGVLRLIRIAHSIGVGPNELLPGSLEG